MKDKNKLKGHELNVSISRIDPRDIYFFSITIFQRFFLKTTSKSKG